MNRRQVMELQRNWAPPDKLDRSRPRPVRLTGGGLVLLVVAVMLVIGGVLAGIVLGVTAGRQAHEQRMLGERGVDTEAQITRLWRRKGESPQYWMAYQFTAGGRTYERQVKTSLLVWKNLKLGSPLAVRYLPSNPESNYPRGHENKPMPALLPYIAAAALAVSGGLAPLPILRQRRLLSEGRAARGLVTHHTQAKEGKMIHYEFVLLSGATAKGKSGPSKHPPAIADTICVLYEPENPKRNAPYPLSLVRPAAR